MSENQMRVAVEGCGHGTLHAIYASVEEGCRVKGWKGVDLLIIGGDFQAVRNQHDLNVTAMPQKYRTMADFHEYYSGTRMAPYLTIFIGGNHEASNHLFELYYGGWVAPNIYYLGAANVLRLGPLRIAGLSGIWKGYDYRKPHFERLPYNQEDTMSIFHVRELDVRKLLSLRSQVDIGLSHDWPQGVEWHGDHDWLFSKRRDFKDDSNAGKLGSVAARQCLDRLRPPFWFSAHLHTKYAAIIEHEEYQEIRQPTHIGRSKGRPQIEEPEQATSGAITNGQKSGETDRLTSAINGVDARPSPRTDDVQQVSAWQNFHVDARQADAEERNRILQDQQDRQEEAQKTGHRTGPQYKFEETFKKVIIDDGLSRELASSTAEEADQDDQESNTRVPNLDGCGFSRPLKRRREASGSDKEVASDDNESTNPTSLYTTQVDGRSASAEAPQQVALTNPDAIDIDMSDDEEEANMDANTQRLKLQASPFSGQAESTKSVIARPIVNPQQGFSNSMSEDSDGGMRLSASVPLFKPAPSNPSLAEPMDGSNSSLKSSKQSLASEKTNLNPGAVAFSPRSAEANGKANILEALTDEANPRAGNDVENAEKTVLATKDEVSEEMRAELAALSSKFTQRDEVEVSPALPFPEAITNKTTNFLALGKCESFQEFLQLLEIESITEPNQPIERPCKLEYDRVWLATLRVFAPELSLGDPHRRVPIHRGETYYHERILEEQRWVEEHIVERGLLKIPENFSITAPVYNPDLQVDPRDMPREVTNPQTAAFCGLIGIENPFDITEEERDARMAQGPRSESASYQNRPRGGFRGGGRGGRGNRSGGRAGNRGRGRGGGRSRY